MLRNFLHFRLISHVGYIINCDKRFRIKFVDKIHQLLVFGLVYDRDDFFALLHVIGTIGFVDRSTAMQLMKDKFPKFFFLWSDDNGRVSRGICLARRRGAASVRGPMSKKIPVLCE